MSGNCNTWITECVAQSIGECCIDVGTGWFESWYILLPELIRNERIVASEKTP